MERTLVASVVGCVACGDRAIADDGADTSSTDSDDASSTQADEDAVTATDSGSADAPATTADETSADETTSDAPICGDGQLDRGEECDDGSPGCVDCMRVCGLEEPISIVLTNWSFIGWLPPLVAVADGSGDFVAAARSTIHRIAAGGEEQWVRGFLGDFPQAMAATDTGELWVAWSRDDGSESSVARHALGDGDELERIVLHDTSYSYMASVRISPDGDLLVAYTTEVDEMTRQPVVQRRTPDAAQTIWSTAIAGEPSADGYAIDDALGLEMAEDGAVFLTGTRRFDFDTDDPLIVKVGADGTEIWQRTVHVADLPSSAFVESASPLSDGGVAFVAARYYDNTTNVLGNYSALDTRAVRLDSAGETVWELDLSEQVESGTIQLQRLEALEDGRFVASAGHDADNAIHPWIGYLDEDGTVQCSVTSPHPSGLQGIATTFFRDADGALLIQGFADDGSTGNLESEVRWMARLYPY